MIKKIKTLQDKYKKGETKKAEYEAEIKKLLDDEYIEQDEYDEALSYDPEGDKPIYTQAEVDSFIVKKANALVKKSLKEAGIDVEANSKDLMPKVVELLKGKAGDGKAGTITEEELKALKAKAQKYEAVGSELKDLRIENAILKVADKYAPEKIAQVVRAVKSDYMSLVDYDDEDGTVDIKSIDKALKRCKDQEPNLFKEDDGADDSDTGYAGKGPGGSGGAKKTPKEKEAQLTAQALEMLGIKKDK